MELLATQVWVLLRSTGVLAAWKPLLSCLFAREFGGAGLGSVSGVVLAPPRIGAPLGQPLRVRGAGSGSRWGIRAWKVPERSGEAWTAPLPSSQVLGSGAKVRVRPSSSAWATAAALGAEVEQPRYAKDERLGLSGPASGGPAGNCLGPEEPGSTLWSLQSSGG